MKDDIERVSKKEGRRIEEERWRKIVEEGENRRRVKERMGEMGRGRENERGSEGETHIYIYIYIYIYRNFSLLTKRAQIKFKILGGCPNTNYFGVFFRLIRTFPEIITFIIDVDLKF